MLVVIGPTPPQPTFFLLTTLMEYVNIDGMRDVTRMLPIIIHLQRLWHKMPDQRLGQLIVNLSRDAEGNPRDPWNMEDDEMLESIYKMLDEQN